MKRENEISFSNKLLKYKRNQSERLDVHRWCANYTRVKKSSWTYPTGSPKFIPLPLIDIPLYIVETIPSTMKLIVMGHWLNTCCKTAKDNASRRRCRSNHRHTCCHCTLVALIPSNQRSCSVVPNCSLECIFLSFQFFLLKSEGWSYIVISWLYNKYRYIINKLCVCVCVYAILCFYEYEEMQYLFALIVWW